MDDTPQRKYALTRLGRGDYLLPSNDATALWRILSYYEDGSALRVDSTGKEHPIRGFFWGTARYRRPLVPGEIYPIDEWQDERYGHSDWYTFVHEWLPTRKAAIAAVLRTDAGLPVWIHPSWNDEGSFWQPHGADWRQLLT